MFSGIHDGLMHYVHKITLFCCIFIAVGIGAMCLGLKPDLKLNNGRHSHHKHDATPFERSVIILVGTIFAGGAVLGISSTADWMRRASSVMRYSQPVAVRLTTHLERTGYGRRRRLAMYASLTPSIPNPDMPPITDIPIYTGIQGSFSRYTTYQDADAQVYLGRDQQDPMVIKVEGDLLITDKSYHFQAGRR